MKTTYIYRVDLGHNGKIEHQKFCYARNAKVATEYYKDKYHYKRYDIVKATAFGTADSYKHPGPIEELPEDEVKYLTINNIGFEDAYSQKPNIPTNGEFIPVNKER